MSLRPLQSRILVKPDISPDQIGSIVLPETAKKPPSMSGEVIAIGHGPASAKAVRLETFAECIGLVEETTMPANVRNALADALAAKQMEATESELHVGDYVLFSYTAGHTLTVDGTPFIVLTEDDCLATWTPDEKETAA